MPFGDDVVQSLLDATLPLMQAPPVNLGVICRWLGIEVYAQPCRAFGALFLLREGRGVLLVNSSLPQGRARFSIAHELGHLLLRHNPLGRIGEPRDPDQERQADRFASELLMPESLLREDCEKLPFEVLCRRYRVSRQAMRIRLESVARRRPS
nr:ImmA/IrrE family metallo-endopeptidase [uncultured Fretibacterium sp.]